MTTKHGPCARSVRPAAKTTQNVVGAAIALVFVTLIPVSGTAEEAWSLTARDPTLPAGMSLWALLSAEAEDAAVHAGYAVNHPTNLENIQRHTRHVRHLIDPAAEPERPMPGRDYGVSRAARTMLERLNSRDQGLSEGTRRTAQETLRQTLVLAEQILANCAVVIAATSADMAVVHARDNTNLLAAMRHGDSETGHPSGLQALRQLLIPTE